MTTPLTAHVSAASINQTVGDWTGNTRRILEVIEAARDRGARLVVLPELCIPGYSLGDRLFMRGTLDRSWACLQQILPHTRGIVALVGLPIRHRDVIHNACAVCADGQLVGLVPKENLATGDVQYENRWYAGWTSGRVDVFQTPDGDEIPLGTLMFQANGLGRFAVEICEDGWMGLRPGSIYALCGAHVVANPSASWFTLGKHATRRRMVEQISREDKLVYLYCSLLGCDSTRLVFDGSVFVARAGEILDEGRRFLFDRDWELVDRVVDLAALERARLEEGSWRQQVEAIATDEIGKRVRVIRVQGDFSTDAPQPAPPAYWTRGNDAEPVDPSLDWLSERGLIPRPPTHTDLSHLELELALAMALREYRNKCRIPGFALALSGGRDSAMCALLVARALRYDHPDLDDQALRAEIGRCFLTAYMSTENSGDATRNAARQLAEQLGARHSEGMIQEAVDVHVKLASELSGTQLDWANPKHDIPLQNVQARLRGSLIWMLANLEGFVLLATSNKSEAAVGYTTMDGDTSGGLSPISDVPKSLVGAWLAWAARFHDIDALSDVVAIPATAELRPPEHEQTDEGDLMPYAILDRLMDHFVQRGQDPVQMFRSLWPEHTTYYEGDPTRFAAHIRKFVTMFCRAQWKRERFAIGFRVTAFDLDPKTGFRFPPVQAPFREELDELDRYVATLGAA